MVQEGAKIAVQATTVTYSALKDLVLYMKDKARYIKRLEENIQKLSEEIGTINSRKQQIDRNLENSVSKEQTGEFLILVKNIEVIKERYNKYFSKYEKYGGKAASSLQELDALSIINVITSLQERKQTVWTFKFWKLATLSKRVLEFHEYVSRVNNKFNEKYMIMEMKRSNQVKHKTIYDLPQLNEDVRRILSHLECGDVNRISIVGPVGVGKTTILTMLHNKLNDPATYPQSSDNKIGIVMWINCPTGIVKEEMIGAMQNEIMLQLKIDAEKTTSINENGHRISAFLCQKKYTLLMDQVSSYIDLDRVGIHINHKYGKVVVATRTKMATKGMMIGSVVEVGTLSDEDALKLLENICGTIHDKRIKDIADKIIACCGGLPQVITLVADHLKGNNDEIFWQGVKTKLQSDSNLGSLGLGGVGKAYEIMYDQLNEDHMKMCSLYGALFPSEHKIYKDYLIECWKSEGFFNDKSYIKNLRAARHEGAFVLNELTSRYLLESCSDNYVKMPIHFRKVALARDYPGEKNSRIWVAESKNELPKEECWSTTRRMSLVGQLLPAEEGTSECVIRGSNLPECPQCDNISTLLLQMNQRLQKLDDLFFRRMESLQVLDLYRTWIESLPSSISYLKNLVSLYVNDCSHLALLPREVKALLKLEILDIRRTKINPWLPERIGSIGSLRCLRVSFDHKRCNDNQKVEEIMTNSPSNIISKLTQLEELVIEIDECSNDWENTCNGMVDVLARLEQLTTLHFNFPTVKSLQNFIRSSKSWNNIYTDWGNNTFRSFKFFVGGKKVSNQFDSDICGISAARHLRFLCSNEETSSVDLEVLKQASAFELIGHSNAKSLSEFNLGNMGTLKVCVIGDCNNIESIVDVHKMKEMMVQGHAEINNVHHVLESLEKLILFNLPSLEQIWIGSFLPQSFSSLIVLKVYNCPKLMEITPEIWRELKEIVIIRCPKLVKLSMTRENAKNLASIVCEASWWSSAELPNEHKQYFTRFCHFQDPDHVALIGNSQADVGERNPEELMSINGSVIIDPTMSIITANGDENMLEEIKEFDAGAQADSAGPDNRRRINMEQ